MIQVDNVGEMPTRQFRGELWDRNFFVLDRYE